MKKFLTVIVIEILTGVVLARATGQFKSSKKWIEIMLLILLATRVTF